MNYCQMLAAKQWRPPTDSHTTLATWTKNDSLKGMSLLHLAAFLGYSRLVSALLSWRTENPNVILDMEIDALSEDTNGNTPLVC